MYNLDKKAVMFIMARQKRKSTDELIASSFKELAVSTPVDKITINQIADNAGVIRSTFYNHFEDKYDLIKWCIFHDVIYPASPLIDMGMYEEAFLTMFSCVEKNLAFCKAVAKIEKPVSFLNVCSECIAEVMLDVLGDAKPKSSWLTPKNIAKYYAFSLAFMIESWLNGEVDISAKEIGEAYHYIMNKSLSETMDGMKVS